MLAKRIGGLVVIRSARAGDEAAIDDFLSNHAETSMFLRSNLAAHGLFEQTHGHGTKYYLQFRDSRISAVFGRTNDGFMMCQTPDASPGLWLEFARILNGRSVSGMTGQADQVAMALQALGFSGDDFQLNASQPLYHLHLSQMPDSPPADIRPAEPADKEILEPWFAAYLRDTGLVSDENSASKAARIQAESAIGSNHLRLLIEHGEPRAMTSFNAQVADMVQVGGVFVPPEFRNLGYGRKIVAAHLAQTHRQGTTRAILFANNMAAARAYEGIGFRHIGTYRIAMQY